MAKVYKDIFEIVYNDDEDEYNFTKGGTSTLPYNFSLHSLEVFKDARDCCDRERQLLNNNKDNKYIPLKNFNGMYECFTKIKLIDYGK